MPNLSYSQIIRRLISCSVLACALALGGYSAYPAAAQTQLPPTCFHEYLGRRGDSPPQVAQNLKLGMMNGLTFSPPAEDEVSRVARIYGAGLMSLFTGTRGIPIISTRVTGLVGAISDGVTGLLVPPRVALPLAAVLEVVGDSQLLQRFGRAAFEYVPPKVSKTRVNRLWMAENRRLALPCVPDGDPARMPAGTRI